MSNPPPERNRHKTPPSNLKPLENDDRNLNVRRGNRRKAAEQDVREGYAHCGGFGGDAVSDGDGVFFAEPEDG